MTNKSIKPRISNGACFGTGDNLTSLLVNKKRLPKDSPAHRIYSKVEHTKNAICLALIQTESEQLEEFDAYTLYWLRDNLHSLGSHCFLWGKTKNHTFPENLLEELENRIYYFQSSLEDCEDFLIQTNTYFVLLDEVRVWLREVEAAYVAWHRTLFGELPVSEDRKVSASILNRVSTYLFNLERYYAKKWGYTENVWKGATNKPLEYNPPHKESTVLTEDNSTET